MTNGVSSGGRGNPSQRREDARIKARQLRESQKKRDRRNRLMLQGGIGVAVVVALAIVAVIIVSSIRPPVSGPLNMASDGIVIGEGLKVVPTGSLPPDAAPVASTPDPSGNVVSIRIYADYLCPTCSQFMKTNGKQIEAMASSGAVTVEFHPVALLTSHSSGTKYSLRAANAAGCVANASPNHFYAFNSLLFKHQPGESSPGLSDAQLKKYVASANANSRGTIDTCIDKGTFEPWVQAATDRAVAGPIPGTDLKPSKLNSSMLVLVDGKQYSGSITDADEFKAFVLQASAESYQSSTATPTPTSTPAG
jgi:protein-disulfide isomerase